MDIIQIKEENTKPVKKQHKIAVGIDFGTTNSLVAYAESKNPKILVQKPTIISNNPSSKETDIRSIKRLIGKSYNEIKNSPEISDYVKSLILEKDGRVKIKLAGKENNIEEAISFIILDMKKEAENILGQKIEACVITVPAHFDDVMRSCVKEAASLADFEVLRLISEPTAAAYAYGLENKSEGKYAIYDLGGGTFDISLLRMKMGVFQVLKTDGNNKLGGDDIDYKIAQDFMSQNSKMTKDYAINMAKAAKEFLAKSDKWQSEKDNILLTKKKLEEIAYKVIQPTIQMTENIIARDEIEGIVLVGGSTKMPLIKSLLKELHPNIYDNINPDEAVVDGAALQARNLTKNSDDLLIDAVPLSLGMETMGGIMEKIILRNSPLPISVSQEFTTYADNQTEIQLNIFQGEREMVKDCRSLGKYALSNIPPMKAGSARIEVIFNIDADGLLTISASEKLSGNEEKIEVRPTYGIDDNDIESIVEESYKHARSDHEERLLAESVISANREIDSLEKAFLETPDILPEEEISAMKIQIEKLQEAVKSNVREDINNNINLLKEISEKFREERMNYILKASLKGKKASSDQ